jgi:hypothetical protein
MDPSPCAQLLDWVTAGPATQTRAHTDGVWCCPLHGPMLTGREAAERAGWAPMRFAAEAA